MLRGGGQVVSVLGFYSDFLSSNPTEAYSFSVKFAFENKQKEAGVGPLKNTDWKRVITNKHMGSSDLFSTNLNLNTVPDLSRRF